MSKVSPELARSVIKSTRYITLATVDAAGQPWNAPVAGFPDEHFNFYWASDQKTQHSQNIRANGKAFVVIYNSARSDEEAWGVYLHGTAQEISDETTANHAAHLFKDDPYLPSDGSAYLGAHPRRIYQFTPEKVWMNDGEGEGADYVDFRVEVHLL